MTKILYSLKTGQHTTDEAHLSDFILRTHILANVEETLSRHNLKKLQS